MTNQPLAVFHGTLWPMDLWTPLKIILTTPILHIRTKMPPKYVIQWGSVWHKSRQKSRDFYRKYGIRTQLFYGIPPPPLYAIWTVFIGGAGGLSFVDPSRFLSSVTHELFQEPRKGGFLQECTPLFAVALSVPNVLLGPIFCGTLSRLGRDTRLPLTTHTPLNKGVEVQ